MAKEAHVAEAVMNIGGDKIDEEMETCDTHNIIRKNSDDTSYQQFIHHQQQFVQTEGGEFAIQQEQTSKSVQASKGKAIAIGGTGTYSHKKEELKSIFEESDAGNSEEDISEQ